MGDLRPDASVRAWADGLPHIVWTAGRDGSPCYFSRRWFDYTGLTEQASLAASFEAALHPDDVAAALAAWERALVEGDLFEVECRLASRSDGTFRWFLCRALPIRDARGRLVGWSGTYTDVDDAKRAERRARERAARLEAGRAGTHEFLATLAALAQESLAGRPNDTYYERALHEAVRLVAGAHAGALLRRHRTGEWGYSAVVGRDRRLLEARVTASDAGLDPARREPYVVRGPDATPTPGETAGTADVGGARRDVRARLLVPVWIDDELRAVLELDSLRDEEAFGPDAREAARLFARQIGSTMRRTELERDLLHQAHTDVVTDVPNRRAAESLLATWLQEDRTGAVLFLDVDDFKHVNEACGHAVGDELLRAVAARVSALLDRDAFLARWGGDEFVVVLSGFDHADGAVEKAREIEAALRIPFDVAGHTVVVSGSVGIAAFDGGTALIERVILEADIALNEAKRSGRGGVVPFSEEMGALTSRRFMIERTLREALETDDPSLRLQYQARVDPASGRTVAVEALSRWTHKDLGVLSPSEFIPIAETTGLIHALTKRVLGQATAQARAWLDGGTPRIVSVNLSAACIRRMDIVHDVHTALEKHRLPPALLELEVTETAAMRGMQESVANLEALRGLGVSLSIDDFGTAYSSLSYLRLLPVDTIKIDRSFVSHIADDVDDSPTDSSIVRGIVALGRSLGMAVVAEGVETESQATFLRQLGCDGVQGFYFGESMPAEAFV